MGKGRLQCEHSSNQRKLAPRYRCTSEHRIHSEVFPMAETQVSIRIDLESGGQIGPGKIALLEAIRETGSITAAAES